MTENPNRRRFVKESLGISTGILAGLSLEHQALLGQLVNRADYEKTQQPVKGLQKGRFGELEVSRLMIGGNLISGSAHAGDLVYQDRVQVAIVHSGDRRPAVHVLRFLVLDMQKRFI